MAGEALIGALRVTLGLDSAKFETGLQRSRSRADTDAKAIQKSLDGIKGRMDAVIGGKMAATLFNLSKRALDFAGNIGTVAAQLGVTTKELQEYRYAASQVGVKQQELEDGLARLTVTMGKAKAGSKAQVAAFRELGVSIQDANGRVYTAGEVIPKLADALAKVKDPATRARLEVELFGRSGQKLATLLGGGSAKINELRDAAQRLGRVLSDRQIQDADRTAAKLADLKNVLEANISGVVADNANAILNLANAVEQLTGKAVKFAKEYPLLVGAFGGAAAGFAVAGPLGAAAGAASGAAAAISAKESADDQNMDLRFRRERLLAAKNAVAGRRAMAADKSISGMATLKMDTSPRSGVTEESANAELVRQTALMNQALAAAKAGPSSSVTDGDLPAFAPGKTKTPRGPTDADRARNFQQELLSLQADELGLRQNITADTRERAMLEHQRVQVEKEAYEFNLDEKVKSGQIGAADAERLKLANARNDSLKNTATNWQLDDDLTQQELMIRRSSLQTQGDLLHEQAMMARTTAGRREIELKILANQIEMERLTLKAVQDMHSATQAEKTDAAMRLEALDKIEAAARGNIERTYLQPLAAYFDSLPKTADEVNEAFENIAANGVQNMVDGLAQASTNVLKLKGVAGQLFNQLIADMMRLQMQRALTGGGLLGGLGKLLGAASPLAGSAGIFAQNSSFIDNLVGQPITLPKLAFANGGSFTIGGRGGIDMNILSLNGSPIARVSQGERIAIDPDKAAQNGSGDRFQFDLRGAVMTADLLNQMNQMAQGAAVGGAMGGANLAQNNIARRSRNRIP